MNYLRHVAQQQAIITAVKYIIQANSTKTHDVLRSNTKHRPNKYTVHTEQIQKEQHTKNSTVILLPFS